VVVRKTSSWTASQETPKAARHPGRSHDHGAGETS
jgi:hypothetical protein